MADSVYGYVVLACVWVALILFAIAQVRALRKWNASVKQLRIALADISKRIDTLQSESETVAVCGQPAECLGQVEYYEEQDRLSRKGDITTPKGDTADVI